MRLADPAWLGLVVLALVPWVWGARRSRLVWPSLAGFGTRPSLSARFWRSFPWLTRAAAIVCLAVAIARPQVPGGQIRVAGRGVAIIALIDRSSSMKNRRFPTETGLISRLEAAKTTLARFVQARDDDLVGLVKFANYPDLDAAPTLDQAFLLDAIRAIRPAGQVDDGTNMGDAIAVGLGLVRDAPTRKKVLILLTDGRNAPAVPSPLDPMVAATLAAELGVSLHTIALGRPVEPKPVLDADKTKPTIEKPESDGPDVALLARLAEAGGGQSFVAADADALERIFARIDALEKSPVAGRSGPFIVKCMPRGPWRRSGLLVADLVITASRFRRLP